MPVIPLGSGDRVRTQRGQCPCPRGTYILVGRGEDKQLSIIFHLCLIRQS